MKPDWCRAVMVAIAVFAAPPASAYRVGPPVALEKLALIADLVCKGTVVADRPITDDWFEQVPGFEVRETDLRVVSIIKGTASHTIRFRHYTPSSGMMLYRPQSYTLAPGRTYLLFAVEGAARNTCEPASENAPPLRTLQASAKIQSADQ